MLTWLTLRSIIYCREIDSAQYDTAGRFLRNIKTTPRNVYQNRNDFNPLVRAQAGSNEEKKMGSKISLDCPFKWRPPRKTGLVLWRRQGCFFGWGLDWSGCGLSTGPPPTRGWVVCEPVGLATLSGRFYGPKLADRPLQKLCLYVAVNRRKTATAPLEKPIKVCMSPSSQLGDSCQDWE